jgi:hypothetical protein
MSYARQMIDAYPRTSPDAGTLAETIETLDDCAQACTADVDADLGERHLAEMVACIRLCLNCADVCTATARVASRRMPFGEPAFRSLLDACAAICKSCGDECERHAQMHEHCRVCAEACRRCERTCRELISVMG